MAFAVRPAGKPAVLGGFSGFRRSSNLDTLGYGRCKAATLQAKVHSQVQSRHSGSVKVVAPTRMMFERFTEKAIKVVMLAQEEARRLGHNFVGTEQILLGLIGESTGIAAKVLKSMGVSLKDARVEVEKIIGRGSGFVAVEIPFTPRAKRVLELSLEEARQLGKSHSCRPKLSCSTVPKDLLCFNLLSMQATTTLELSISCWVFFERVKVWLPVSWRLWVQTRPRSGLQ